MSTQPHNLPGKHRQVTLAWHEADRTSYLPKPGNASSMHGHSPCMSGTPHWVSSLCGKEPRRIMGINDHIMVQPSVAPCGSVGFKI
ncbi:hypothetical protein RRG08_024601 [Elysia crispata]|uniref:Uncharacterized protein n=1 Tax=Elysia crispata TaxID=231223 RepID=A0AAE0ZWI7_9GAST|nr:hypothetical protein RRG08_024601 [Elysia crispata]